MLLQLMRHRSEIARVQDSAAADRRVLEQELAAAQRQASQLQQQDQAWQQQLAQLEQQEQHLQQQLAQQQESSLELQQQLHEQQQQAHDAQASWAQALASREAELQQLREQLTEAEEEAAALLQQLQQDQGPPHLQRPSTAGDQDADADASTSEPAAVVHALRAELGIANAEVARLRHQLDVAQASQQQERELTGHEILRLQQELSEAAASGSAGAPAAVDESAAEEVTSRLGTHRVGSDSTSSWHSVHNNPAFEQQQQHQPLQRRASTGAVAAGRGQHQQQLDGHVPSDHAGVKPATEPAETSDAAYAAASKLSRYEAKLRDQAETISSLQRQLKQQEQLLVTLQKRERRVRCYGPAACDACMCRVTMALPGHPCN